MGSGFNKIWQVFNFINKKVDGNGSWLKRFAEIKQRLKSFILGTTLNGKLGKDLLVGSKWITKHSHIRLKRIEIDQI